MRLRFPEDGGDRVGDGIPAHRFAFQLPAAAACQPVVLRVPVVLGEAPLRFDPALDLEPMQCGVQRSFLDTQDVLRHQLNAFRDGEPVIRARRERTQDQ